MNSLWKSIIWHIILDHGISAEYISPITTFPIRIPIAKTLSNSWFRFLYLAAGFFPDMFCLVFLSGFSLQNTKRSHDKEVWQYIACAVMADNTTEDFTTDGSVGALQQTDLWGLPIKGNQLQIPGLDIHGSSFFSQHVPIGILIAKYQAKPWQKSVAVHFRIGSRYGAVFGGQQHGRLYNRQTRGGFPIVKSLSNSWYRYSWHFFPFPACSCRDSHWKIPNEAMTERFGSIFTPCWRTTTRDITTDGLMGPFWRLAAWLARGRGRSYDTEDGVETIQVVGGPRGPLACSLAGGGRRSGCWLKTMAMNLTYVPTVGLGEKRAGGGG